MGESSSSIVLQVSASGHLAMVTITVLVVCRSSYIYDMSTFVSLTCCVCFVVAPIYGGPRTTIIYQNPQPQTVIVTDHRSHGMGNLATGTQIF